MEDTEGLYLGRGSKLVSSTNESQSNAHYGTFQTEVLEQVNPSFEDSVTSQTPLQDNAEQHPPPSQTRDSLDIVDLSYKIKERPGQWWNGSCFKPTMETTVLHNLNMTFIQGELSALVGSSGSGKTSLLDVMSGRVQGELTGDIRYQQNKCTKETMKQVSSYVLQADRLLPTLTVTETLTFMAYLKLPGSWKSSEIDAKVQSVINEMGLHHVANSRIGGAVVRGVSGGEKRRITIGVHLLQDPEILLLDEPTSGLDSFTARQLVSSLRDLAHKGKIVIMSIHQPRTDIFNLLDKMSILSVGHLVFQGQPNELVPYFTSIGHPCPADQNPCDVYIDITSVDRRNPTREKSTYGIVQNLCNTFTNSELHSRIVKNFTSCSNKNCSSQTNSQTRVNNKPSWFRQFQCILNRMNVHLWRDRTAFLGRLMILPFFVPFILIFMGRMGLDQESIQNRLGLIYQSTQVTAYVGFTNCVAMFPALRELFYRESQDGLYSTFTFLVAYYVHCLPFNIVSGICYCAALYWTAGLNSDLVAFGSFILVCVMIMQFGEMMGVSILGVIRNVQLANNTSALVFSASGLLASGLLRAVENMPQIIQWAGYIAIHKYATEIVVANEFHGLQFYCDPHEVNQCLKTGDDYLNMFYTGATSHVTRDFVLLGSYSVAIYILAAMMFKARGTPTLH